MAVLCFLLSGRKIKVQSLSGDLHDDECMC